MYPTLCLSALTAALGVWVLMPRESHPDGEFIPIAERSRRERLRNASAIYWFCGGLLRRLDAVTGAYPSRLKSVVQLAQGRLSADIPWTVDEWLAAATLGGIATSLMSVALATQFAAVTATTLTAAVALGFIYFLLAVRHLCQQAKRRLQLIRRRLPFVIDSMALAIECGASVYEGLTTSIGSRDRNEIQQEISLVVADVNRGRPLIEALADLKSRLREPMIDEFIGAISISHRLGCEASELLLATAGRMRQRRAHEIETAAGRAQVKLSYPGFLLTLVCMAVVVAPFFAPMTRVLGDWMK